MGKKTSDGNETLEGIIRLAGTDPGFEEIPRRRLGDTLKKVGVRQYGRDIEVFCGTERELQVNPQPVSGRGGMWRVFEGDVHRVEEGDLEGKWAIDQVFYVSCGVCGRVEEAGRDKAVVQPKKGEVKEGAQASFSVAEELFSGSGRKWRRTHAFGSVCPDKLCREAVPENDGNL